MLETLACLKIQGGLHDLSENSGGPIVIPSTDQKEAPLNSQRLLLQIFSPKDELCKRKDKYGNKHKKLKLMLSGWMYFHFFDI